jgi:hypothetical protein
MLSPISQLEILYNQVYTFSLSPQQLKIIVGPNP